MLKNVHADAGNKNYIYMLGSHFTETIE